VNAKKTKTLVFNGGGGKGGEYKLRLTMGNKILLLFRTRKKGAGQIRPKQQGEERPKKLTKFGKKNGERKDIIAEAGGYDYTKANKKKGEKYQNMCTKITLDKQQILQDHHVNGERYSVVKQLGEKTTKRETRRPICLNSRHKGKEKVAVLPTYLFFQGPRQRGGGGRENPKTISCILLQKSGRRCEEKTRTGTKGGTCGCSNKEDS